MARSALLPVCTDTPLPLSLLLSGRQMNQWMSCCVMLCCAVLCVDQVRFHVRICCCACSAVRTCACGCVPATDSPRVCGCVVVAVVCYALCFRFVCPTE